MCTRNIIALRQPITFFHFLVAILRQISECLQIVVLLGSWIKIEHFVTKKAQLCAFYQPTAQSLPYENTAMKLYLILECLNAVLLCGK